MGPRAAVFAGLLSGAAVAVAILIAAVALLPDLAAAPTESPPASSAIPPATTAPGSQPLPSVGASIGSIRFHIGEPAPPLSVAQLGGGQIDLANLAGHPVWINFMQTTCPPCVDEFPLMSGFATRYAEAGLVVVAIDVREDEGTVGSFVRLVNARFPVGLDADGSAAAAWDAIALPIHFWVDRDGVVRAGALGGIGPDVMAENLGMILPDVDVTP
ncbi:MAG: TlpA disulfide reductase family protein [Chloroflexota bacterium]